MSFSVIDRHAERMFAFTTPNINPTCIKYFIIVFLRQQWMSITSSVMYNPYPIRHCEERSDVAVSYSIARIFAFSTNQHLLTTNTYFAITSTYSHTLFFIFVFYKNYKPKTLMSLRACCLALARGRRGNHIHFYPHLVFFFKLNISY